MLTPEQRFDAALASLHKSRRMARWCAAAMLLVMTLNTAGVVLTVIGWSSCVRPVPGAPACASPTCVAER